MLRNLFYSIHMQKWISHYSLMTQLLDPHAVPSNVNLNCNFTCPQLPSVPSAYFQISPSPLLHPLCPLFLFSDHPAKQMGLPPGAINQVQSLSQWTSAILNITPQHKVFKVFSTYSQLFGCQLVSTNGPQTCWKVPVTLYPAITTS